MLAIAYTLLRTIYAYTVESTRPPSSRLVLSVAEKRRTEFCSLSESIYSARF